MSFTVDISAVARTRIIDMAATSSDGKETGGLLLGRGPNAADVVHVEQAGDPGPQAVRRPDFFLRDLNHADQLAARAWALDRRVWVGEWHTHPGGQLQPSSRDLSTYATLLADVDLGFKAFVSIIVVPDPVWTSPRLVPWLLVLPSPSDAPSPEGPISHVD